MNSIAEDIVTRPDAQDDDARTLIDELGRRAREAARVLANVSTGSRNDALRAAAVQLRERREELLEANALDVSAAEDAGRPAAFLDRLRLDVDRIEAMAEALENIAELPDPVGRVLAETERPNGLRISRVSTPIGVIGMIFESRPNVGADAGALCVKSGNAVILRGGSESRHSIRIIADALQSGLATAGLPADCVQFIDSADRRAVTALLQCVEYVDLVIPRGGRGLVSLVRCLPGAH